MSVDPLPMSLTNSGDLSVLSVTCNVMATSACTNLSNYQWMYDGFHPSMDPPNTTVPPVYGSNMLVDGGSPLYKPDPANSLFNMDSYEPTANQSQSSSFESVPTTTISWGASASGPHRSRHSCDNNPHVGVGTMIQHPHITSHHHPQQHQNTQQHAHTNPHQFSYPSQFNRTQSHSMDDGFGSTGSSEMKKEDFPPSPCLVSSPSPSVPYCNTYQTSVHGSTFHDITEESNGTILKAYHRQQHSDCTSSNMLKDSLQSVYGAHNVPGVCMSPAGTSSQLNGPLGTGFNKPPPCGTPSPGSSSTDSGLLPDIAPGHCQSPDSESDNKTPGDLESVGLEEYTPGIDMHVDQLLGTGMTVGGYKPRGIIRKRKKSTIPGDLKDRLYWEKRRKNNDSARRSREAKKEKERGFYKRALELEYENLFLKERIGFLETKLTEYMKLDNKDCVGQLATDHLPGPNPNGPMGCTVNGVSSGSSVPSLSVNVANNFPGV